MDPKISDARGRKTLVIVLVAVGVLAALGALGLWLSFDYAMENPQESGWMD